MERQLWLALFGLCVATECAYTRSGTGLESEIRPRHGQLFLKAGFNIVDFSVPFGWKGPEQYDFTETDTVKVAAPCHSSFASEKYRKLAYGASTAFITHLDRKYGNRIVGYFLGNGVYGEWSWSASWEVPPGSPPSQKFGVNRPGLMVNAMPWWKSVYSIAPILPSSLLRNGARAAGCYIYSDVGEVVYANRNLVALYAPGGASRTLRPPRAAWVTDLLSCRVMSRVTTELPLQMELNTARVLGLE